MLKPARCIRNLIFDTNEQAYFSASPDSNSLVIVYLFPREHVKPTYNIALIKHHARKILISLK